MKIGIQTPPGGFKAATWGPGHNNSPWLVGSMHFKDLGHFWLGYIRMLGQLHAMSADLPDFERLHAKKKCLGVSPIFRSASPPHWQ